MSHLRGPKHIRDVLGKIFASRGCANLTTRMELEQLWQRIADERTFRRTRVGTLRRGVLEILVDNAPLLQELESFGKYELLAKFREAAWHNKIKGLRFRRM